MLEQAFDELTRGCQHRFQSLRRKQQFFTTFAGGVMEALRSSGYRLSDFAREASGWQHGSQNRHRPRSSKLSELSTQLTGQAGQDWTDPSLQSDPENLELLFEHRSGDLCRVLIIPYRTDLPFLVQGHSYAQLGLELSRYSNDPDLLRRALTVNTRASLAGMVSRRSTPRLALESPPTLKPPGSMSFELKGARTHVYLNLVLNLERYAISDLELDSKQIARDFKALFYGMEKFLSLMLENLDPDSSSPSDQPQIFSEDQERGPKLDHHSPESLAMVEKRLAGTVPLGEQPGPSEVGPSGTLPLDMSMLAEVEDPEADDDPEGW